jgi:HEPN domain-containing protein
MQRITAEWVRKAEADLVVVRKNVRNKPAVHDATCFHCQQAVEKYFKALLQELGQPIPHTHDLGKLLQLLVPHDGTLKKLRPGLRTLTLFAVEYRYPGKKATGRQARFAIKLADSVRREIRKRLGLRTARPFC